MKKKKSLKDVELRLSRMKVSPGDLVLVKGKGVIDPNSRMSIIRTLGAIEPRASIMFLPHGLDMENLTEDQMHEKGWFRGRIEKVNVKDMFKMKAEDGRELMERLGFKK